MQISRPTFNFVWCLATMKTKLNPSARLLMYLIKVTVVYFVMEYLIISHFKLVQKNDNIGRQ